MVCAERRRRKPMVRAASMFSMVPVDVIGPVDSLSRLSSDDDDSGLGFPSSFNTSTNPPSPIFVAAVEFIGRE